MRHDLGGSAIEEQCRHDPIVVYSYALLESYFTENSYGNSKPCDRGADIVRIEQLPSGRHKFGHADFEGLTGNGESTELG